MAFATEGLRLYISGLDDGPNVYLYTTTDIHTDVDATDYFTDGDDKGMRVNDLVVVMRTATAIGATLHVVTAVTAGGAATVAPAILA